MPPKTPTIRKKIVKTTTPKPPPKTANPPTTTSETTHPEITAITSTPEIATGGEANTTLKAANSSVKTAVSRKTAVSKTPTRKTTASPKSASQITNTAAETGASPETDAAASPKATSAAADVPDTASEATTVAASAAETAIGAASEATATEATATLERASDPQISGTLIAAGEISAPNAGSAENASNITKPKTTIKVVKKIVKRKKVIRKPVGTAMPLPSKEEGKDESNPKPQQLEENGIPDLNSPPSPLFHSPTSSAKADPVSSPLPPEERIHDVQMEENEAEKEDSNQAAENESEKGNLNENESVKGILSASQDDEAIISERRRRRKTEIFVGGLDKDAKEEDIRKVFEKVGEIAEIRLMMNSQTGKNKGYAFLRYASAADAKRAVTELAKVEVRGKQCGVAAAEGNDTIFLGNIDKKWKKEDVIELLREIGIENIDIITVMADPNDPSRNRGFAFLELETNKDAQNAYKKLQKKNVFGKDRHITVSWAEPLNDPDEEEMKKVKSVYADGIPSSWDEDKVRKHFKKFGEIERIVLARNLQSAKRKDFAFVNYRTRDSALACIESLNKEGLVDEGAKVNIKVSLAKPVTKGKKGKAGSKSSNKDYIKEKPKPIRSETNVSVPAIKGKNVGVTGSISGDKKSSTQELIQVLREQAAWKQGQAGLFRGSASRDYEDHLHKLPGGKRPYSSLGDDASYLDPRGYPRARLDSSLPVSSSSYGTFSHGMSGSSSLPYQQRPGASYTSGSSYGTTERFTAFQTRHGSSSYGGGVYPRY